MALRKSLILRRPQSGRLEGRTALVQLDFNFHILFRGNADLKKQQPDFTKTILGQPIPPTLRAVIEHTISTARLLLQETT
jgi:hypothetical protein